MAVTPPVCQFDAPLPPVSLIDETGTAHPIASFMGPKGLLVMFICNHCPYVRSILDRIVRDAHALLDHGVNVVAISANDPAAYPEDAPEKMAELAREYGFRFPYLFDSNQQVARTFDAQCTPDFFGYNAASGLQYRGRLDSSGRKPGPEDAPRELFEAMIQIADTGLGPRIQTPSMGCSIKWRDS